LEVASALSADRDHDRVVLAVERVPRGIATDLRVARELDRLWEQLEPAIDDRLLDLEVGDAVTKETTGLRGCFEDRDGGTARIELDRRGKSCGSRADDRDARPTSLASRR